MNKHQQMLKHIRRVLALVFIIGITLTFIDFTGTFQPYVSWMAKMQFLPNVMQLDVAVIVGLLVLTFLFGRIYCSVICPLGVMQDLFAYLGKSKWFRKNKKAKLANKYSYSPEKRWLRLAVLVLFIIMLVAGFNAGAVLLAPYSAYGRIVASFLQPIYIGCNNLLATWAEQNDSYMFYQVDIHDNPAALIIVASASAIILFVLAFMHGRTYCNTICPVGTVLGYASKCSLVKIKIDEDKCIKCGLCAKNCKAACIDIRKGEVSKIDYSRCVMCGNCIDVCNKDALNLGKGFGNAVTKTSADAEEKSGNEDISRRSFLSIVAGTAVASAIKAQEKTTDGGLAAIEDKQVPNRKTPITPPGAISAKHFQQHCTACQLCISNCPNGVLRPDTSLEHFLQPVMEYDKGYCRPECTRCSDVCPAGAILPLTIEDKAETQIGHAVWVRKNCIPVADGNHCGNCARHCPTGAIQMVPLAKDVTLREDGGWYDASGNRLNEREVLQIPVVDTETCIGCGSCENLCPARPFSAIYVEGHEVHRKL